MTGRDQNTPPEYPNPPRTCGDALYRAYPSAWGDTFPLPAGQKFPPPAGLTGRNGRAVSDADRSGWWDACRQSHGPTDHCNIGLRLGQSVIALDVDAHEGKPGAETLKSLTAKLGPLPKTYRSTSRGGSKPGGHYFYRVPAGLGWRDAGPGIETLWRGHRYAVVWPSWVGGRLYRWYTPTGHLMGHGALAGQRVPDFNQLPELPQAWVEHLTRPATPVALPAGEADCAVWAAMSDHERAVVAQTLEAAVQGMARDLQAALAWPEGYRDERGRGWEKLAADTGFRLAQYAYASWTDWTVEFARLVYDQIVPAEIEAAVEDTENGARW